jgi:hypothetical protein
MPIEIDEVQTNENCWEIWTYDTEKPQDRHLAFMIDKEKEKIIFFPKDSFCVGEIELGSVFN